MLFEEYGGGGKYARVHNMPIMCACEGLCAHGIVRILFVGYNIYILLHNTARSLTYTRRTLFSNSLVHIQFLTA